ncbi:MAG: ROK family protein [Rhodobiaceae bacterium]
MTITQSLYAGIDAGGTSFKCALADGQGQILARAEVKVDRPDTTLNAAIDFFRQALATQNAQLAGFGIACFGPIARDPAAADYGCIGATPKPGWQGVNIRRAFGDAFGTNVTIDTDVNGALLAEMAGGAAQGCDSAAYVTVGTGIGAALYANGGLLAQPGHAEFGHIRIARHAQDDFTGICPFHGDCLEGLASAPALQARFGAPEALPADHIGWEIIADYLAQAALTLHLSFRPVKIIFGGGLMQAAGLHGQIRTRFDALLNGYAGAPDGLSAQLVCAPGWGADAGLRGGLLLARQAEVESEH